MNPGDIVLVRFPQTDLQIGKLRPALVVALSPGRFPDVTLSLITSRISQAIPGFDVIIQKTDSDFESSGLKARSVIRLARIATVASSVVDARLGSISQDRLRLIRKRLAEWLQKAV